MGESERERRWLDTLRVVSGLKERLRKNNAQHKAEFEPTHNLLYCALPQQYNNRCTTLLPIVLEANKKDLDNKRLTTIFNDIGTLFRFNIASNLPKLKHTLISVWLTTTKLYPLNSHI